jgi:hypothetical protein
VAHLLTSPCLSEKFASAGGLCIFCNIYTSLSIQVTTFKLPLTQACTWSCFNISIFLSKSSVIPLWFWIPVQQ